LIGPVSESTDDTIGFNVTDANSRPVVRFGFEDRETAISMASAMESILKNCISLVNYT